MTSLRLPLWTRRIPWHWVVLGPLTLALVIWMCWKVKTEIVDPQHRMLEKADEMSRKEIDP